VIYLDFTLTLRYLPHTLTSSSRTEQDQTSFMCASFVNLHRNRCVRAKWLLGFDWMRVGVHQNSPIAPGGLWWAYLPKQRSKPPNENV